MASSDTTTTPAASSAGLAFGTALAQPVISFIQGQIGASLPSQVASLITSQFPDASAGSGQSGLSVQLPAAAGPNAGAALGSALAQPAINFIRQQISAGLPDQLASLITAQFPANSSQAGSAAQPSTAAAALQALTSNGDLKDFFSALSTPSA